MPTQSFLPIIDLSTKVIHGMVPISSTNFVGTETTRTIGGHAYPIAKYEPVVTRPTARPWYMAITQTYLQVRKKDYSSIPGYIGVDDMMPGQWWTSSSIGAQKREDLGALLNSLIFSFGGQFTVTVEDPPTVDDSGASYVWTADVPFANQPQCSFFDFNWVEAVQLDNQEGAPVSLVITSTTDENDAPQSKVRSVVVQNGQPTLNRATFNTVRVVKMPGQTVVAGDEFKVKATIYGQNGFTANVEILVTVS